jgi:hypothetical protein
VSIASENLAQITARSGVLRSGTGRSGAAPDNDDFLKVTPAGEIIWNRPLPQDGNPDDTASGWTTSRS